MAVMTEATAVVVVHVVVRAVVVCAVVHKQHWLSGSVWERDIQMNANFILHTTHFQAMVPGLYLQSITT